MTRFLNRLSVFALITAFVFSFITGPFFPSSVYAQSTHTSDDIEYLKQQAANDRAFAKKRRNQAEQWQKRADKARKKAEDSNDPAKKERLLEDARTYDRSVAQATDDAEKAEAKAAQAEAEIKQAKTQSTPQRPSEDPEDSTSPSKASGTDTKSKLPAIPLEQTLGVWRINNNDNPFVIVQKEPDLAIHAYKLEAHTGERIWKGEYSHFDEGDVRRSQNARLVFKYKPKFDEMNPKIPQWARKSIEGELEWKIELDEAGTCGTPALTGYLFPGEVKWNEKSKGSNRSVKVIGRGKPRFLDMERTSNYEMDLVGRPVLYVHLGSQHVERQHIEKENQSRQDSRARIIEARKQESGETQEDPDPGPFDHPHDPFMNPIEGLTKRQRFFIQVSLPYKMAKEQGKTLEVSIKGLTSGESDTVTLTAGGVRKGHAVNYTNREPMTIADSKDPREQNREARLFSWTWLTNSATGARLDLDVENGEEVEFRFGDVYETIPVYDSWVQRNVARFEEAAYRLRIVFEAIRDNPKISDDIHKKVRERLKMLDNMRTMLDSGYLTDVHKHELLRLYIDEDEGMALRGPEAVNGAWENKHGYDFSAKRSNKTTGTKMVKSFLEGFTGKDLSSKIPKSYENVQWTTEGEKWFVKGTLRDATNSIVDEAFETLPKALALGMYDGVVSVSVAGDIYLIATSHDHFGKKRTWIDRVRALVGLVSSSILYIYGPRAWDRFSQRSLTVTVGGKDGLVKLRTNRLGSPRVFRGDFKPLFPESLKPAQVRQITLRRPKGAKSNISDEGPVTCRRYDKTGSAEEKALRASSEGGVDTFDLDLGVDQKRLTHDKNELGEFYEHKGKFLDPYGKRIFPRQQFGTCNVHAFLYILKKKTGEFISEMRAYIQMVGAKIYPRKNLVPETHPIKIGSSNFETRSLASLKGIDSLEIPWQRNHMITLEDIAKLRKAFGYEVKIVLSVGNMDKIKAARRKAWDASKGQYDISRLSAEEIPDFHAVAVHDFIRDANGRITHVQFFDPAFGRIVELPDCDFSKRMARIPEFGNTTFFAVEKGPIALDLIGDAIPSSLKPTARSRHIEERGGKTIHDIIDEQYPDKKKAPRLNVIEDDIHETIKRGKAWMQPNRGGASFSTPGRGTIREGDVVIRIKKDFEKNHIEWRSDAPYGDIPIYWPEGKGPNGKWRGKHKTYIPKEQLEYLDPRRPGELKWRNYSE